MSRLDEAHLLKCNLVADVGCGKGRHSAALHALGHDVIGYDLSPESVVYATAHHATSGLSFFEHDMREPLPHGPFDAVVNLFTSFGYFDSDAINQSVLQNFSNALKPTGIFVMDYLHPSAVVIPEGEVTLEQGGFVFEILKKMKAGFVEKDIVVKMNGEIVFETQERVRVFEKDELPEMISKAGFSMLSTYGDYELGSLTESFSRQIFVCEKK